MNWINQHVIDGVVNGVGKGAVVVADATYDSIDQRVVDGVVNGAGAVTEGTGEALRPVQSGKVSITARSSSAPPPSAPSSSSSSSRSRCSLMVYLTDSANNWLLPVGVFLPVAGIARAARHPAGRGAAA